MTLSSIEFEHVAVNEGCTLALHVNHTATVGGTKIDGKSDLSNVAFYYMAYGERGQTDEN